VDDAFSRTGTVHVLSTSGLHLAVVAGSIAFLLANLPVPRPTAGLITIVLVWLFALTAGAGPAVTRSALMLTIVLLAPLARRHPDPTGGLIVAGWVILIASPLALYDAGTQFSFATVATLLAWFPVAERALFPWEPAMPWSTRLLRGALLAVAIGVIAQAGSWPLAAYHFNLFSIIAPLANPLIVLLANALLVGGLALVTLLAPLASFPPVLWLWGLLELGLRGLRFLALAFGALPLAAVSVVTPPVAFILVYYALLLGAAPVVNRAVLRRTLFAPDPPDSLPPARRVDPPAAGSSNTGGNGAAGPGGLPLASGGRAG
jgi:competence protein ComEC